MIHYVCKYTPLELFKGFGEECAVLEEMPENFELSDQIAHANLCGFHAPCVRYCGKYWQM